MLILFRRIVLSSGLFIGILLLAVALANPDIFHVVAYAPYAKFSTSSAAYDTSSPSNAFMHVESAKGDVKEFHIAFRFRVSRIRMYDDLFETAPVNSGIRAEIAKPGTLAVIAASSDPPGYRAFIVSPAVSLHDWHTFDLSLSRNKRIQIAFDGRQVTNEVDPDLRVDLSHILFGNGVSGTRPFDGQIVDGTVSYAFLKPAWWAPALDTIARVVGLLLILVCGGFLLADVISLLSTRDVSNTPAVKRRRVPDEDFGANWRE